MGTETTDAGRAIVELERAALARWGRGDPDGFLELSAPDVTYFDPFVERRLDGLEALRSYYGHLRGKVHIDHFELLEPSVHVVGDGAVLSFRFASHGSEGSMMWNTTEVYRKDESGWRIVHTHWAFHRPKLAGQA